MGELSRRRRGGEAQSAAAADPLELFHPLVARWFREAVGQPTEIQQLAWPRIAAGEHVLISAPTGSGKTLTAFLSALDALLSDRWTEGPPGPRVLYVSPLKALNTDIQKNLDRPLTALRKRFEDAGREPPAVTAMTRSGDTPQADRRRMLKRPPEILITTPESLNILLTSKGGRGLLGGLRTVILDEIHAVAGSKRGTHLITAVDRLVPLAGEFQRIALSATVHPMERVADFVGGYELWNTDGGLSYRKRKLAIVQSKAAKTYQVEVRFPLVPSAGDPGDGAAGRSDERDEESVWEGLVRDFKRRVERNRSTLFFANSRRITEKVARLMNENEASARVYSHHGSLSREVRSVVESRLKDGELDAIIATNSLELGIDIGQLDEVVLVQTPRAVASAVQRVGRAGHGVGEVSRGVFYPTHGRDFLDAAVVARAIGEQDIEPLRPVEAPLDVLAQVILSMVAAEPWELDQLYAALRTSSPYHRLERRQFDLVIDMLAGRYADSRVRELHPRIAVDKVRGTVRARPGAARLLYTSGGTIADRGYYTLRVETTQAKVGELDEEFVWERSVGDTFTLGTQSWQVKKITHNDVLVSPARGGALAPFWRADAQDRSFAFSQKVGAFLTAAESRLGDKEFARQLEEEHCFEPAARVELLNYLSKQKAATGRLPHGKHVLVERCGTRTEAREDQTQTILHTLWGGSVNRPFAMALQAAWEEQFGDGVEVFHDDDCLLVRAPRVIEAAALFALVDPDHVESLLRRRLEATGYFGARFRINASTALLLPRAGWKHRTPLWMNRQRAKRLMASVANYGDFPILLETWRTCLLDEFELDALKTQLRRVREGELPLTEVRTETPSPMAAGLMWMHTNFLMYEDDTPEATGSAVRQDLLQELVFSAHLRPRLPPELCEQFRRKVQRTAQGYGPAPGDDLHDWLVERLAVPPAEWEELVAAVSAEHEVAAGEVATSVAGRALWVRLPGAEDAAVVAVDRLPRLLRAVSCDPNDAHLTGLEDPAAPPSAEALADLEALLAGAAADERDEGLELLEFVGEWARFQGPFKPLQLGRIFGFGEAEIESMLGALRETNQLVVDQLTLGVDWLEICDAENLEILLRWLRRERRPSFEALPAERLPLFLAHRQGLAPRGVGGEDLEARLEQLFGYPALAELWESEFLPARLDPYYPAWLDSTMQSSDLLWWGCGEKRITFGFPEDLPLFRQTAGATEDEEPAAPTVEELFPDRRGKYELDDLARETDRSSTRVSADLWQLAWAGEVTNDTFLALRQGLATKFKPPPPQRSASRRLGRGRRGFDRWKAARSSLGNWFALEPAEEPGDALELEELGKDRARLLLERYGLVCRELVAREPSALRWPQVFRALRLMELSGEVLAGHFFEGIRGLQFITHDAFRDLRENLPEDAIYWFCAADPASLCGLDIEGLKGTLPPRVRSNHLVYHGARLVLVSKRRGRELDPRVEVDHPHLAEYFGVLKMLLTREVQALSNLEVETIAGEPALKSAYVARLAEVFRVTRETKAVRLWKRY